MVDQGLSVVIKDVEPDGREGKFGAQALQVHFSSEAPRGDLEGLRVTVGGEADHFAVENQVVCGKCERRFHHFGNGWRDFVQGARVDPDFIAASMHLDACAVELVFEARLLT